MPVAVRPLLNSKDELVSQLIPDEVVQEVLLRTDIVDVIGDYVQLKRTGANAKGLCPFHQEKMPSFYVHPVKQFYKCFGCGAGGDVFDFIRQIEHVGFVQAKAIVADLAGCPISHKPWTAEQKRAYARQRKEAEAEAHALVEWKRLMVETLRAERDWLLKAYHGAIRFLETHDWKECEARGDMRYEMAATAEFAHWQKIEKLDHAIATIKNASFHTLLPLFRMREKRAA